MQGRVVEAAEVVLPLILFDHQDQPFEIDAVIDTGANNELTLPPEAIAVLDPPFDREDTAITASGDVLPCRVFRVDVLWTGGRRTVETFEVDTWPLIGMKLLKDHRLTIDVTDGGRVEITPLTTDR